MGETGKLLEVRRELEKEIERISEDFISSHYIETKSYLDHIRELRNNYQDEIGDFVENYTVVLQDPSVLYAWTKEVKDIASVVKKHANVIWTRVLQFYSVKSTNTKQKSSVGRLNSSSRFGKILPAPRHSPQEPSQLLVSDAIKDKT